jgi:hypothetical protein
VEYKRFRYIYPPRPEIDIHPDTLKDYEDGRFLAQPKLNGSLMEVYSDGKHIITMNRHKESMKHKMDITELKSLHNGRGWCVFCGEYMDKNKKDENEIIWNDKYVIFDILVHKGEYLLKTTFDDRYELLRELFPDNLDKKHLHKITDNIYRVNSIRYGLSNVYNDITQYDMYEGLVIKFGDVELQRGNNQRNNMGSQLKCCKT